MGFYNGYVQLPPGHPWRFINYDNIPADVHGGITYSAPHCRGQWWIGFDTAHAGDGIVPELEKFMPPALLAIKRAYPSNSRWPVVPCSLEYVIGECEALAEQALLAQSSHPLHAMP